MREEGSAKNIEINNRILVRGYEKPKQTGLSRDLPARQKEET